MAAAKTELRVKVVSIGETQEVGNNGFKKRLMEGIIEGEYPQSFQFEFTKEGVNMLDDVLEGTYVTVAYNLRSRKVTEDKNRVPYKEPLFFVSLNAWKIDTK